MASSPLDNHLSYIYGQIVANKTNVEIVAALAEQGIETSEASIRRCIERNDTLADAAEKRRLNQEIDNRADAVGVEDKGDEIIVTLPVDKPVEKLVIEDILERRNLNPAHWEVKTILDNQWQANAGGGEKITLHQFKIFLHKKTPVEVVYPFIPPMVSIARPKKELRPEGVRLGVIPTDPQTPFQLEPAVEVFQQWLAHNRPDFGIWGGDILDNGYISRHRDDPAWNATVQQCVQSAGVLLLDTVNASPETEWSLIKGNHDDRIRNEQLERNERLYGVTQAQWPGEEEPEWVYSLNHLLRLKELGIEYIEPKGTYEFQFVPITDTLAARHGHKTVAGGALKTAIELGHSVVLGHTHRQSVARKTLWNAILNKWDVVTAIEAGCLCQIEGGLGYANGGNPDWQPGFATVTVWPDGGFSFDLATYEQDGILRWRDQKFTV